VQFKESNWKDVDLKAFYETSTIKTDQESHALIVFCPFSRSLQCPRYVSLGIRNETITNLIEVQRQIQPERRNTKLKRPTFVLCLSPLLEDHPTYHPARVIELIEYQKIIGVDKVVVPYLNKKHYAISPPRKTEKVIRYYAQKGYVDQFKVKMGPAAEKLSAYWRLDTWKNIMNSICYLKYSLVYDYVIVHDYDEIVGVNTSQYKDLKSAVTAISKDSRRNDSFYSFHLRNTVFSEQCSINSINKRYNLTFESKNDLKFAISKGELFYTKFTNPS